MRLLFSRPRTLTPAAPDCDLEIVDDRLLIYAPAHAYSKPGQIDKLPALAKYLYEKFERQTRNYRDERHADEALKDPFRRAQVTMSPGVEGQYLVGASGRRLRTRTTAWQKVWILVACVVALATGVYWLGMVTTAVLGSG